MQLQKQYPDQLVVVTLNVDFDANEGSPNANQVAQATDTLERSDISCLNLLSTAAMEDVLSEFEFFGLPAAVIYTTDGEIAARFDGDADVTQKIAPAVAKLLSAEK